ncbi:MAG: hypothetical protein GZ094_03385 [Mariniphaga sp.]|nr:hypothetical protein [Mariniphaga sp.]
MKILIFWFFCFNTIFCFSQCGKKNFTDSSGLKQGFWIVYDSLDIEGYNMTGQLVSSSLKENDYIEEVTTEYEKIKHYGSYLNGKKNGLWRVSKPNNKNWIEVFYNNGEIIGPINVYYATGTFLYSAEKIDDDNFEVKEYDKNGDLIKKKKLSKVFINRLNETKLFVIGYDIEQ